MLRNKGFTVYLFLALITTLCACYNHTPSELHEELKTIEEFSSEVSLPYFVDLRQKSAIEDFVNNIADHIHITHKDEIEKLLGSCDVESIKMESHSDKNNNARLHLCTYIISLQGKSFSGASYLLLTYDNKEILAELQYTIDGELVAFHR